MLSNKSKVQNLISKVRNRLRASVGYELYWTVRDPRVLRSIVAETAFYRSLLREMPKKGLIFDVGANRGRKTSIFLDLGAQVVAVDPDTSNQRTLKQKFLTFRLRRRPVWVVGEALSDKRGVETFWIEEAGSGKNTLNRKWVDTLRKDEARFGTTLAFAQSRQVSTSTLDALVQQYGAPFYIKIDVEGHELTVLRGLKQSVPFLSFEVNLPEFCSEGEQCVRLLDTLDGLGGFNFVLDFSKGLELEKWLDGVKFLQSLKTIESPSVEVFWRGSGQRGKIPLSPGPR